MKDKLAVSFKGKVYLLKIKNGRTIPLGVFKNAVQPLAKEIAIKCLIQHPSAIVDTIALYNGVNLLISKPITNRAVVSASEVKFEATFDPDDFDSDFTEGRLIASGLGNFSIVNNLVGNKQSTESLVVTWNISIS
jgi:hypothetical protein